MARLFGGALAAIAATAGVSAPAHAQMPGAAPPPPAPPPAEVPAEAAPPPAVATPAAAAPPAWPPAVAAQQATEPAPERAASDLDTEARRIAIGYGGISQVPAGLSPADLTVPSLALRYWLSPKLGLDLGLGLSWAGGSTESGGISTDKDSIWGVVLQAGLPIALSTHRHVSFQVIPFLAFGHGQTSSSNGGTTTTADLKGNRVDIGVRAGFELFFGFIGIPELALSATVGAEFRMIRNTTDQNGSSFTDTSLGFTTTVQNNPWDIFAGNVAARYYF